jgi:hypothetical protein
MAKTRLPIMSRTDITASQPGKPPAQPTQTARGSQIDHLAYMPVHLLQSSA